MDGRKYTERPKIPAKLKNVYILNLILFALNGLVDSGLF
jgi:hypothetical protein